MSDKNTDTNWKPWVPKELIDWELKVKEDTELDEKEDWAMLKALRQGKTRVIRKAIRQDYNRVSKKVSVKALLNKNLLLMNGKAY